MAFLHCLNFLSLWCAHTCLYQLGQAHNVKQVQIRTYFGKVIPWTQLVPCFHWNLIYIMSLSITLAFVCRCWSNVLHIYSNLLQYFGVHIPLHSILYLLLTLFSQTSWHMEQILWITTRSPQFVAALKSCNTGWQICCFKSWKICQQGPYFHATFVSSPFVHRKSAHLQPVTVQSGQQVVLLEPQYGTPVAAFWDAAYFMNGLP